MRPIAQFDRFMGSLVRVSLETSRDAYGKPTYGPSVAYRAHLAQGTRMMRSAGGQDVMVHLQAHLAVPVLVPPSAKITLSTGDVGSTESYMTSPLLVMAEQRFDGPKLHHTVLFLSQSGSV